MRDFTIYAFIITCSHLLIDIIKIYCPKGLWNFIIDQLVHLGILAIIAFIFNPTQQLPIEAIGYFGRVSIPLAIAVLLLSQNQYYVSKTPILQKQNMY